MSEVKVKASLPKDAEFNGLDKAADEFVGEPRRPRVAIVVLQTSEITKDLASMKQTPKVEITRIELITDSEEASDLIKRAQALSEERTGNTPLPTPVDDSALDFDASRIPGMRIEDFDAPIDLGSKRARGTKGGDAS